VTSVPSRNNVPIACDPGVFSPRELEEHVTQGMKVLFQLPESRHEVAEGFIFEFLGDEHLVLELARFVANEHRCCPWESFKIEMEPFAPGTKGRIRLHYLGGAEGKGVIADALAKLEAIADDPARVARMTTALRASAQITPENVSDFYSRAGVAD
jgi:hypothetical protein